MYIYTYVCLDIHLGLSNFKSIVPLCKSLTCVSESQWRTMFYGDRPYGVGMLIAGYDVRETNSIILMTACIHMYVI